MSLFSRRFPALKAGKYIEIGIPDRIGIQVPDDVSVRIFATPSLTVEKEGYYLTAIKTRKAGWGNGSAVIMCSCMDAIFKNVLVWCGLKTPCKHADGLRALLNKKVRVRKVSPSVLDTDAEPPWKPLGPSFFDPFDDSDWKKIEEY